MMIQKCGIIDCNNILEIFIARSYTFFIFSNFFSFISKASNCLTNSSSSLFDFSMSIATVSACFWQFNMTRFWSLNWLYRFIRVFAIMDLKSSLLMSTFLWCPQNYQLVNVNLSILPNLQLSQNSLLLFRFSLYIHRILKVSMNRIEPLNHSASVCW